MCTSKLLYMFDVALTRILFSGIFFLSDIELYLPPVVWERELPGVQISRGLGKCCTYLLLSGRESSPRVQILRGVGKRRSSSPSSTASSQARYCSFRGSRLKLNRTLNVSLFIKPVTRLKWKQMYTSKNHFKLKKYPVHHIVSYKISNDERMYHHLVSYGF